MPNGFGRGFGRGPGGDFGRGSGFRGGMGFGFRGSSPPWPFVGRGRGGLPRCDYFLSRAAGVPPAWPSQPAPFNAAQPAPGYAPFAPPMTPEEELDFLKSQAEAIKGQLEQIENRVRDMESE